MRLLAYIRDSASTELVNDAIPQIRRRDREPQFFFRSESIYTPLGLPISIEIDVGGKGQGLTVRSVNAGCCGCTVSTSTRWFSYG